MEKNISLDIEEIAYVLDKLTYCSPFMKLNEYHVATARKAWSQLSDDEKEIIRPELDDESLELLE